MCGIVGALVFDERSFASPSRTSAGCATRWRTAAPTAPGSGSSPNGRVGLGHPAARRSSTCRRGRPADGQRGRHDLQVVFNGEIYNHAEIRAELEALGGHTLADRPLRHRGDPPRLRAVGHRLPPALPRHVRASRSGTRATRELWLVRDRIGIKPLYYSVHHGRLDVRVRDQGAARGSRAGARASTRRRCSTTCRS